MRYRLLPLTLLAAVSAANCLAGDWPQILGPDRNGVAEKEKLLAKWPVDGPQRLWEVKLGEGYGGAVVAGEKVIVFHRPGEEEQVDCLNAASGQRIWSASYPSVFGGGINPDKGPRATPVIAAGKVIVFGGGGDMHCLDLTSGKKLWSRELYADYDAPEGYFGFGSSPIVIGDRVLVNVGSREGAAIAALNLTNGKTAWTAYNDLASYSSPAEIQYDGSPAVLFITRLNCVAVTPTDGKVIFHFPFGSRGPTVNAATPLVFDDGKLFLTASYGIGARYVDIANGKVKTLWSNDDTLSSQYTTPVHVNGILYGTHGREDVGQASLRAVKASTGKVLWDKSGFGVAHVIAAGDKLIIARNDGEVILAEATGEAYRPLASAQIASGTVRAVPALANGRLLIRSGGQGSGALTCVKVGATE